VKLVLVILMVKVILMNKFIYIEWTIFNPTHRGQCPVVFKLSL